MVFEREIETVFSILTYKRPESLRLLLKSIQRQNGLGEYRVFVLNNDSSTDLGSYDFIQEDKDRILYKNSPTNTKMKGKRILEEWILEMAKNGSLGEPLYYAQMDDDVSLTPNWHATGTKELRAGYFDMVGSVKILPGLKIVHGQTKLNIRMAQVNGSCFNVWIPEDEFLGPSSTNAFPVEFAGHRACILRFGKLSNNLHDGTYIIGGEDLDYSLSLRKNGIRIGIVPGMEILHRILKEESATEFRTENDYTFSWAYFYRKWGFLRQNANKDIGIETNHWYRILESSTKRWGHGKKVPTESKFALPQDPN